MPREPNANPRRRDSHSQLSDALTRERHVPPVVATVRVVVYWLLADVVVAAHLAYLAFIPFGGFFAWRWRRMIGVHLVAVAIGLVSITIGFECPLTSWEKSLRERGGDHPYDGGFIDHYLRGKVYPHGYDMAVQATMTVAVIGAYAVLIRRRQSRDAASRPSARTSEM
jgi:Protein of Unknown function (DUF2784)